MYVGILLGIGAALAYSLMTFSMKLLNGQVNGTMVVFFRFLVSTIWVTTVLINKKIHHHAVSLKTQRLPQYLIRSIATICSMLCLRHSLKFVPLANANVLNLTYTLFIPIISYLVYRNRTSLFACFNIILGFIGILIILNPKLDAFNTMSFFSLFSGVFIAISLVAASEIAKYDSVYTIMGIHFWLTFVLTGIMVIFHWQKSNLFTLILLIVSGIMATLYQELLTRGIKRVSIQLIAPLQYCGIIFSGVLDWLVWHHQPNLYFVIGSLIIALSCCFLSHSKAIKERS